jgi:hypothetical protein
VSWHYGAGTEAIDRVEGPEELGRFSIHYHGDRVLDQQVACEQDPVVRQPDHEVPGGMSGTRVADDQSATTQPQGVNPGDRAVGLVGEVKPAHGI